MENNSIKLTFLGTGTSTGVPYPLCTCPVCNSRDSKDKRLRASVIIGVKGVVILIDPGPDFRYQVMRAGVKRIDAVLITHSHYDHVGGIDDLRPFCHLKGGKLPVYCTDDVAHDLRVRVPYCFAEHPYPGVPTFDIHVIDTQEFNVQGINIIPIPVMHNKSIRGYLIERTLAYVTDCITMPASSIKLLKHVPMLVINALRQKPHPTHMSLAQCLDLIKEIKPGQAYLTHMADAMGFHAEVNAGLPEGVQLAYDTLSVNALVAMT